MNQWNVTALDLKRKVWNLKIVFLYLVVKVFYTRSCDAEILSICLAFTSLIDRHSQWSRCQLRNSIFGISFGKHNLLRTVFTGSIRNLSVGDPKALYCVPRYSLSSNIREYTFDRDVLHLSFASSSFFFSFCFLNLWFTFPTHV